MLFSLQNMPDWSEDHPDGEAKCRKLPSPRPGRDPFFEEKSEAKALCNGDFDGVICPRREQCLHMSMINYESYGVWGGMTEDERRALRVAYPSQPYRWTHETLEEMGYGDS